MDRSWSENNKEIQKLLTKEATSGVYSEADCLSD